MNLLDMSFGDETIDDDQAILRLSEQSTLNPLMTFVDAQDQNYRQVKVTDKPGPGVADSPDILDFFSFPITSDEQFLTNPWTSNADGTFEPVDNRLLVTRSNSDPAQENVGPRKIRRRIDEDEWCRRRSIILNLYETNTLEQTMQTMEKKHDFKASKSAFKDHLRDWSTSKKNIPKEYAVFMLRKLKQRMEEQGKSTSFRYCGKQVAVGKIKRASADHDEAVSIRSTTPSNISIITPRDSSCDHPDSKKRSVEEDYLHDTDTLGSLPRKKERLVDIHQDVIHVSPSSGIPPIGISLKDRLEMHAYTQKVLYEELSLMSSADLCELSVGYDSQKHLWGNELILENILVKSEGSLQTEFGPSESNADTSCYKIAYVKAMIAQRRFFTARMVLENLQVRSGSQTTTTHLQLQLLKLALLVDIDEDIQAPRSLDRIEDKCLSLITEQDIAVFKFDRYWPGNLVLAYLFRLYGIHERPIQFSTAKKMQKVLEDQFTSGEKPSRSLIWAAHQYVRWCLRNLKYEEAGRTLDNTARVVKIVTGPGSPEAVMTEALLLIQHRCRYNHDQNSTPPELVDVYSRTTADVQWEKAFRGYLWNEPCPYMDYSYPTRRKDYDKDYWR
ncbi:hypothetical protein MMC11_009147 [Xylographa trunciseda]|nr:hypothetical protein [Xylographa trunciseda]